MIKKFIKRAYEELRNVLGDLSGYSRCPISGNTFMGGKRVHVPYHPINGIIISSRTLEEITAEEIGRRIYKIKHSEGSMPNGTYSYERIAEAIRNKETIVIRRGPYSHS